MSYMIKCETCSNAIFDSLFGEYKCTLKQIKIYKDFDCKDYKNGEPKETLNFREDRIE